MSIEYIQAANQYILEGKLEEANATYQQAIASSPNNREAYLSLAKLFEENGNSELAMICYEKVAAIQPEGILNLGHILQGQGKQDAALVMYERVIASQPEKIEAYLSMAHLLNEMGKQQEAVAVWQQAIAVQPDLALPLADRMKAEEKLDVAITFYQQAIAVAPENIEAYASLGQVLKQQGDQEAELVLYQKAIQLKAELGLNLAIKLQALENLDVARFVYKQVIAAAPKLIKAYLRLGYLESQMGNLDSAIASWQQAISLQPDAASSLGDKLKAEGKSEVAIALYQYAIAIQPELVELHLNLGYLLLDQKKIDAAMQCCQQALELDPSSAAAQVLLGVLARIQGDSERAFSCYQQAVKNDPNFASAYTEIGKIMLSRGRKNDAISNLYKSNQIKTAAIIANGEIPGIFLNTLPKSGSMYVLEAISNGLNKPWMRIVVDDGENISRGAVNILADEMKLAHEHLPASLRNLCLITEVLDRLIVHVRDPRQAILSWVHHLSKTIAETEDVISLMHIIPDAENYFSLSLTDQISWQIEKGHLSAVINFIEGWLDAEANPSFYPKILFTKYEDLAADPQAFFESILNFYEIDKSRFTFPEPPQQGKLHYRQGRADEWREVFTSEQAAKASSMIPKRLFDKFGWSPT
ncbi:tetratricopeptide repeat protein [Microcoleus sp. T2B6]|uniref:tetratricopeptide repeat protein n=1 Tax=Microcoleus sp. T2B6 TaxID=3055424 RepID=UPI002FD03839